LEVDGRSFTVAQATPEAFDGVDIALFSAGGDVAREWASRFTESGCTVVDNSSAWRMEPDVPLVVAEINPSHLESHRGIVANPNCSAIQLACVLKPLLEAAGLARVRLATYQAMSGAGDPGIERLRATAPMEADLAFDWEFEGEEFDEETKLRAETRKILALPELPLQAQCVRVPVLVGHSQAVWVETEEPLSPEDASAVLAAAPHVRLAEFPTPREAAGEDEVLVGRIRTDVTDGRGLALWSVCDNLRKGAALSAVQIAEALLERRLLPA
jgi:aspartate-semialdehyde dehydrogenase